MTRETRAFIEAQLAAYGRSLSAAGEIIHRNGCVSQSFVTVRKSTLHVRTAQGARLWSGPVDSMGAFLEAYWFAKRVDV